MSTGVIVAYYGEQAPRGWLPCDGSLIPQTNETAELRNLCGPRTPDLRGLFIRGLDFGTEAPEYPDPARQARKLGDVQVQQVGSHFHYTRGMYAAVQPGEGSALGHPGLPYSPDNGPNSSSVNRTEDYPYSGGTHVPAYNDNRPNNMALLYIIKL